MKRICALLATLMIITLLPACADPNAPFDTTATEIQETAATQADTTKETVDKNGYLLDNLEDCDLNRTITMLVWSDAGVNEFNYEESANSENVTVGEAVAKRNNKVCERMGVEFEYVSIPGNAKNTDSFVKVVAANEMSGNSEYDIIASYSRTTASCALAGYTMNLLESDSLDFSMPWWPKSLIEQSTINDRLFFASGDISANVLYNMTAIYFNREMINEYKLGDPYELVSDGKWTFDTFLEMCNGVYSDDNASTEGKDKGDSFAYMATNIQTQTFLWGCGQKMIRSTESGIEADESFASEKTEKILSGLCRLLHDTNDGLVDSSGVKSFSEGRVMFISNAVSYATTTLRGTDLEYGIIPVPKYDESQKDYYSVLNNTITLYAVPTSVKDFQSASMVLECLASENYRIVSPAVFEITLKTKYAPDAVTSNMYNILRNGMIFDLGRIYSTNLNDIFTATWNNCITGNSPNLISVMAGKKEQLESLVKTINDAFKK